MAALTNVSPKLALGLVDKVVGLGKEVAGEVLDKRSLVESGQAQQDKGTDKLKALREEAKGDDAKSKVKATANKASSKAQGARQKAADKAS